MLAFVFSNYPCTGNWVEELRLLDETGVRYFPSQKDKSSSLLTRDRVITHSERVAPKDYSTTIRDTYKTPNENEEYKIWKSNSRLGPRELLLQSKLKNLANKEITEEKIQRSNQESKVDYSTTHKTSFMKDNFSESLKVNCSSIDTKYRSYVDDAPITIYSHTLSKSEPFPFPASFVCSNNPFAKTVAFSEDFQRPNLEKRAETFERPNPFPTVFEHQLLAQFRSQILSRIRYMLNNNNKIDGRSIRQFVNTIWRIESSDYPLYATLDDFIEYLAEFDYIPHSNELSAICNAFGGKYTDKINLSEICAYFRKNPSSYRLELINFVFKRLIDGSSSNVLDLTTFKNKFSGENFDNISEDFTFIHNCSSSIESISGNAQSIKAFTANDFFDYYIDLSSEVDDDNTFERILTGSWIFK